MKTWRKNGAKLSRRKAIRQECRNRMQKDRRDHAALEMYLWVQGKIRRFYDIAPLNVVWPAIDGTAK